jgi:hypothetical protein
MSGFPLDSSAIFKHYERKSLIIPDRKEETLTAWLLTHHTVNSFVGDKSLTLVVEAI